MKYFIIEIIKPFSEGKEYRDELQRRINSCEFEVVSICESEKQSEKENVKFIIENVKNQTHKHYEIIKGDGISGLNGLRKKIQEFYNKIDKL